MSTTSLKGVQVLPCAAETIADSVLPRQKRFLLFGPPGTGKSTLAVSLGREFDSRGYVCSCIGADPGSPGFGLPGAVSLATWENGSWRVKASTALCSLDAGRFRLPLVSSVQQLVKEVPPGILLIDGPGVVRGPAGRELLQGLVRTAEADTVLLLTPGEVVPPLLDELYALGCELVVVHASAEARRPGKRARARRRTEQWEAYLAGGTIQSLHVGGMNLIGAPPPLTEEWAWSGRQVALQQQGQTVAMGEVLRLDGEVLQLRLPQGRHHGDTLLVRDAARTASGLLETAPPFLTERIDYLPPADLVPFVEDSGRLRVAGRVGSVDVALLNGVFGDPLLHLRLCHQGRSLLFDLGTGARLQARLSHQVSDIFISHAHMDHLGGFLWFLRSRLEILPSCNVYGPPGLADHIFALINGFLWDRIAERAPTFIVSELHGEELRRYRIVVGGECEALDVVAVSDGIILEDKGFSIRAVELDHLTPVLAYALVESMGVNVRKDRLEALGLEPGPWLTKLKQAVVEGQSDSLITMPDGSERKVEDISKELLLITPGKKLVYATDLGDTIENRRRLVTLAKNAHTLFCEAPFIEDDADHAARSGHLTTRACGEIAAAAGVARLIPFHFSRRYSENPQQLYDEIDRACECLVMPREEETIFR